MGTDEQRETLYIQAIENLFLAIRKQGLMLSPVDRKCARDWFDAGVPLGLVCQSILDECTQYRERKPSWSPLPMRLSYFSKPIHKAFKASQTLAIPSEPETPPPENSVHGASTDSEVDWALEILESHGKSTIHSGVRAAYRSLYQRLRSWGKARHTSGVGWVGIWRELDHLLVQEVLENLSPQERETIDNEVESQFRVQRRGLGNKARTELRTHLLVHSVRHHFSLLCLEELRAEDTRS